LQPQRGHRASLVQRAALAALKVQPGMGVPTWDRRVCRLLIQTPEVHCTDAFHTLSLMMSHDAGWSPEAEDLPLILCRRQKTAVAPAAEVLQLRLSADERTRLRGGRRSVCGRALLLQLPREQPLEPGEWLLSDDPNAAVVRVEAASEAILVVRAAEPLALLQAAYHLGNRHVALELQSEQLMLLDDPVLADLLQHRGLQVERRLAPFLPEGGAYGHSHS